MVGMEDILMTCRYFLRRELTTVDGLPVYGHYIGRRAQIFRTPAIVIHPEGAEISWATTRFTDCRFSVTVAGYVERAERVDEDLGSSLTLRAAKFGDMIRQVMMRHVIFYVFEPCYLCGQRFYTIEHIAEHGLSLADYVQQYPNYPDDSPVGLLYQGIVGSANYQHIGIEGSYLRVVTVQTSWNMMIYHHAIGPQTIPAW